MRILAALVLALFGSLCAASCLGPAAEAAGPLVTVTDGDRGGGALVSAEDGQQLFLGECLAACNGGPKTMAAWCRLLEYHPDPAVSRACWEHVDSVKLVCLAWCGWTFV
jgi:hypothetical protein